MQILISSLFCGYEKIKELDRFIKNECKGKFGAEYTFKNDKDYIPVFEGIIKNADYPISFHGPLIGAEPASRKGTEDYEKFIAAYEKTFELAKKYNARHVVYHTSYLPYKKEEIAENLEICIENTEKIIAMAKSADVKLLVENLPTPPKGLALIDNKAFFSLFNRLDADIIIDTGHANITGLDYGAFIEKYSNRVEAYHFHNNEAKADTHKNIFEGTFDFDKMKKVYQKFTPKADIIMEYKPNGIVTYDDIKKHAEYVFENFNR